MMFHLMSDYSSDSSPTRDWPEEKHKFCNARRISVGLNPKGCSDSERAKSPTSPLDINTFSGVGITEWHENSLDSQLSSPEQQRETIPIGSPHGFTKSTHETGMEHSESYTCVISHGSKWSTKNMNTHCGMECEIVQHPVQEQNEHEIWDVASPPSSHSNVPVFSFTHFLSSCYLCKRQLSHDKDIYMYRGDKAFCSVECRSQQILMDDGTLLPTDFDDFD